LNLEITTTAEWAVRVAERWGDILRTEPDLVMCLPTGATPKPVYAAIAGAVAAGDLSFAASTVFLLDEFGGLAPGDPGRCDTMIRRDLLDGIDLPETSFHRFDPDEEDLDHEVARYWSSVVTAGLDLTIVGLGLNGHVGLNEPGSAFDSPARRVELQPTTLASQDRYGGDHPATWGLTLGMVEILSSQELWLIVTGAAKAEITAAVLEGPITPDVPGSLLRDHNNLTVFLDEPAASQLTG